jgi:hypothetical protein
MENLDWRDSYKKALMELNPAELPHRLEAAQYAIEMRIANSSAPLSKQEFDEITGAIRVLRFLMSEAA